MSTEYNGWTNYETWCANLWLTNSSGDCEWLDEQARECVERAIEDDAGEIRDEATRALADILENYFEELAQEWMPDQASFFADMLNASLSSVNWHEIASHAIADTNLYSAGWNMPGYLPDNPPAIFLNADDALEYIKIEAGCHAEDEDAAAVADVTADWTLNKSGEFGQTVGKYHYFVTKI